jgi:hypothetical protein
MTHAADCVCWPSAASLSGVDQSLRPDWIGTATLDRAGISDCGLETASTVEALEQGFKMARCAGEILADPNCRFGGFDLIAAGANPIGRH